MINLFLILNLFHVGNTQPDEYSFIESTSCGQLTATPEQLVGSEPLFESAPRIYHGEKATYDTTWYPWAVEIKPNYTREVNGVVKSSIRWCSGSILNSQWVISAAHCFFVIEPDPDTGINRNVPIDLNVIELNFGMFGRLNEVLNVPMVVAKPARVIRHQQYLGEGVARYIQYDIALVKLDQKLEFTVITGDLDNRFYINSICLPRVDADFTGTLHTAAGFGKLGHVNNINRSVMAMDVPLTNYDRCFELSNEFTGAFIYTLINDTSWLEYRSNAPHQPQLRDSIICSSILLPTQELCPGDSGGPLMIQRSGDGRYELTGVNRGTIQINNNTINGDILRKTGSENRRLANSYALTYRLVHPCGHQPQFINTFHFLNWIRDTIIQDQQQYGQADLTKYFVYTLSSVAFLGGIGATIQERFRNKRAAKQQQPPLTPSGVLHA